MRRPEELTAWWLLKVTGEYGHPRGIQRTCNGIVARLREYLGR